MGMDLSVGIISRNTCCLKGPTSAVHGTVIVYYILLFTIISDRVHGDYYATLTCS